MLVAELVARIALPPPRYHDAPVEFDPEFGFRGIPNHRQTVEDLLGEHVVALNPQGMRGRPLDAAPRVQGTPRVVFVGDSFLVGRAVADEELVTSRVEAALAARGRPAEVYNVSTIDWGTAQELLAWRSLARPLAPDATVLFLYPANDLVNNAPALAGRTTVSAGDPIRPYLEVGGGALRVRHLAPLRAALRARSRLFATLERRWLATRTPPASDDDAASRLRSGRAPREDFELFRRHDDAADPWSQAWERTFALLRAFRDETRTSGSRLLVVVVPHVNQVVRNAKALRLDVGARLAAGVPLDRRLDWNLPEERLARFLREEGIDAVFLLGPLRERAAAGETVYARDEHLAPAGHAVAAERVLTWLEGDAPGDAMASVAGRPVALLPPAERALALLDFRAAPHAAYLGDGWYRWRASGPEGPGGWRIGPSALAALPARDGDLVVRGRAPAGAAFPILGQVAVLGVARAALRIERPGPFELRLASALRRASPAATADGYVAVLLAPGAGAPAGSADAGLVVESLGFEASSAVGSSAR